MITVEECVRELLKYPRDAMVYAYEGESTGIVVVAPDAAGYSVKELGFIPCRESWKYGEGPSGLYVVGPKHE